MGVDKMIENIVNGIMEDLDNRRGLGLDNIDDDVIEEIKNSWKNIIKSEFEKVDELEEEDVLKQVILDYFKIGGNM
jgi:hypothetical protein